MGDLIVYCEGFARDNLKNICLVLSKHNVDRKYFGDNGEGLGSFIAKVPSSCRDNLVSILDNVVISDSFDDSFFENYKSVLKEMGYSPVIFQ